LSVLYYEGIKIYFESIFDRQTGITKIIFLASPFLQASIIVHFHVILDHEGHNSGSKTFFIMDQSSKKVLGNFGFLFGFFASSGIFQIFPVIKAPGIRPSALY